MKPIGPLMIEHRVIERILPILERGKNRMRETGRPDYAFIDRAVDFFGTFVDDFHHGKEEKILFKQLDTKSLSPEHGEIMAQLVAEHVYARHALKKFQRLRYGCHTEKELLDAAVILFETFLRSYPAHIEKEDRHFFFPTLDYLSQQEQAGMLEEFSDFDRKFIYSSYEAKIKELEDQTANPQGPEL